MSIDNKKLDEFLGKYVVDLGSAMSAVLASIGDGLGLYTAMAGRGGLTPAELAQATKTHERYVREWLGCQAAGGYVAYDPSTGKYALPEEQAAALADETSPCFMLGSLQLVRAMREGEDKIVDRFRTGGGLGWGEQSACLFEGCERFFRPGYVANLVSAWIPAIEGLQAKLTAGAKVADVGCGHGASTLVMAEAFPKSRFIGFDNHGPSIEVARQRAQKAGLADRVRFEVASAVDFPGKDYDLIAHFDCLHDLGNPVGAARQAKQALAKGGVWMLVEPYASDQVEENLNPVGRIYYAASTMLCVPASLSEHGPALGAQAGEARLREVASAGGFPHFRRATQTPFNIVFEGR